MVEHFGDRLVEKIRSTKSFLCLGVDPHLDLIPKIFNTKTSFTNNLKMVENFCFSLLDTAHKFVPVIKPQVALFEQLGPEGMKLLSSLCKHAHSKGLLVIMDAKRGDIGSTSQAYANAYLGKNAPFPKRRLGLKLAKDMISGENRPDWHLFGRINQNMETVLFREKFLSWPDKSR